MRYFLGVMFILTFLAAAGKMELLTTRVFPMRKTETMLEAIFLFIINLGLMIWAGILLWIV